MIQKACLSPIETPIRWENLATVQQNLFGEWELYCCWGGIGTRRGNSRVVTAASREDAQKLLTIVSTRRLKRHYTQVRP